MKYRVIADNIIADIVSGKLKSGDKLLSIRNMVVKNNVNKSTVIKAYGVLEKEHYVYSIPKSGYFVLHRDNDMICEEKCIDFSVMSPDEKLLPYMEFNHCISRAIETHKRQLFNYGEIQGLNSLRQVLAIYLREQDIYTKSENIHITSGAQQAINMLCQIDFPNNKNTILIEQPTYTEIPKILHYNKCEYITIDRDEKGLDLNKLEELFKNGVKFFYTMSRFHNPLGTNLSLKQKKRILQLAYKYDVYIVEDDYLGDLEFSGKNLPLYYYDINERVIYIRSFSKSFIPGIRLGFVVASSRFSKSINTAKRCIDFGTSVLNQGALELYIMSGMYEKHIDKVRKIYKKNIKILKEQLKILDNNNYYINEIGNGYVVWINLHNINSTEFVNKLYKNGVKVSEGKNYFIKSKNNCCRICFAHSSEEDIRHGIRIIYDLIKRYE